MKFMPFILAAVLLLLLFSAGCIGTNEKTEVFIDNPAVGYAAIDNDTVRFDAKYYIENKGNRSASNVYLEVYIKNINTGEILHTNYHTIGNLAPGESIVVQSDYDGKVDIPYLFDRKITWD